MTIAQDKLAASARSGDDVARRNAVALALATGFAGANAAVIFATAALVGQSLSGDIGKATIPASTFVLGIMLATIPVAWMARRLGRRLTFLIGNLWGALAGALAALAVVLGSFWLLCFATFLGGAYQAVVQSYRFAAADTASPAFRPTAISWVLTGGVAAAFIGPQLVIWTKDLLLPWLFLATFLGQGAFALAAMLFTMRFINMPVSEAVAGAQRPLGVIARQPKLIVAILCGTLAQALMNFVMTAAPLAMAMCGHSVTDSTLGIQWHVIAMFAPSFVTGHLISRFGKEAMIVAGLVILALCGLVNVSGITVMHFWAGLVLLGIGWNFAFIAATALVTDCHTAAERTRVQGFNDFIMFSVTTVGSFMAGHLLGTVGWSVINWSMLPLAALGIGAALWLRALPHGSESLAR
jgi:MFS family permease